MKKQILAAFLMLLLMFGLCPTWAVEETAAEVTAVDGNVTISCTLNVPEGTPVFIAVLQAELDGEEDVTAKRVEGLTTPAALKTLNPEYLAVVKAGADGAVSHTCQMKDSLATGLCHVIFNYIGADSCKIVGSFEHVGKNDLNRLVQNFNADNADYAALIQADMAGKDGAEAKNILAKSSADTAWYASYVAQNDPTEFCTVLAALKPKDGGFDIGSLISAFNEAAAWIQLRIETDTFGVLKQYNGKYWNLSLNDASDYAALTQTEQTSLLAAVAAGKYTTAEKLENDFAEGVLLAVFRALETREALAELIGENSAYASYFAGVREKLAAANISNEYTLSTVYNTVLAGRTACKSMADIETLFTSALPKKSSSGGSGSTGGGGGGSKVTASGGFLGKPSSSSDAINAQSTLPFTDVPSDNWARTYIQTLYEKGAVNGVTASEFVPTAAVARQDFVKMLMGVLGIAPSKTASVFSDVTAGHYSEGYVMAAYEYGFISGLDEALFGVGQSISREDAAVILSRVLAYFGLEPQTRGMVFVDSGEAAEYAQEAIEKLSSIGIFGGDDAGRFNPKAELSRAETCAVLCRLADRIKGE